MVDGRNDIETTDEIVTSAALGEEAHNVRLHLRSNLELEILVEFRRRERVEPLAGHLDMVQIRKLVELQAFKLFILSYERSLSYHVKDLQQQLCR